MSNSALNELRWHKFPVLDDGFVCLVDAMGDDAAIVRAARVSYGRDKRAGELISKMDPSTPVGKAVDEATVEIAKADRDLLRYLYRQAHSTPFEMCEVVLLIRMPMDSWRQQIRHRSASVNEYSTRYTEAIDSCQKTPPDQWRLQSTVNKQGSSGMVSEWPDGYEVESDVMSPGDLLSQRETSLQYQARKVYEERLKFGVAREQARKDLPLSTMTEAYWKIDLKNLLHYLSLRMDSHAQLEIRQYATVIGEQIVAKLFPVVWEAFNDYDFRRDGLILSALDVQAIKCLMDGCNTNQAFASLGVINQAVTAVGWSAEVMFCVRDEFLEKIKRLGIGCR